MDRRVFELVAGFIVATVYASVAMLFDWSYGTFAIGGLVLLAILGFAGGRLRRDHPSRVR